MGYEIFDELCRKHDVTPYQVSKATGVSTSTLSSWKTGRYIPKDDKLQKLADYFGVTLHYMRTGREPIKIEIDPTPHRNLMKKLMEESAPGLSYVYNAYILFNEDDRNEVLALIDAKLAKYDLEPKKEEKGSA